MPGSQNLSLGRFFDAHRSGEDGQRNAVPRFDHYEHRARNAFFRSGRGSQTSGSQKTAATAGLRLPDEVPVSLGDTVSNFAALTGRKPADDATDVALQVVVGIVALQSDNVDVNDVPFLASFPYLAPSN